MKITAALISAFALLGLNAGCSTAPTNSTADSKNAAKITVETNQTAGAAQNVTVSSGNNVLNVKQSNGAAEVGDGKQNTLKVETQDSDADVDDDADDNDSESVVTDGKGNRVTTKTRDGKQTSVIQSGDNKVEVKSEDGDEESEVTDGKGNKVKMKNGSIEIRSADGKKVVVKTPN